MSEIKNVAMITVCGRPNVGKSSLTNALVGEKVAIVSNKAQTTRNRIYGVVNRDDTQFILMDTPGLHKPKSALGEYMVKVVTSSLSDVDCALLLVEPIAHVGAPELALIERVKEEGIPTILCINKIDTVEPAELLPVIAAYNEVWDGFDAIIPISAHSKNGLEELMSELRKYASEGPQLFPDGMTSDQPERQVMGELLREKLLLFARLPGADLKEICDMLPSLDEELLLRARAALEAGDTDRCGHLLLAVEAQEQPQWLLLSGRVAMAKGEWGKAAEYLILIESASPGVIPLLEICFREMGDFRRAYEYACRQKG